MIDEYIAGFNGITHERLVELHEIIKAMLPKSSEKISYGVPTFYNDSGPIVYFAGYKDFVSIYPVHQAVGLEYIIAPYIHGKSTARFSNDKPLPKQLIVKLVNNLEQNNLKRAKNEDY